MQQNPSNERPTQDLTPHQLNPIHLFHFLIRLSAFCSSNIFIEAVEMKRTSSKNTASRDLTGNEPSSFSALSVFGEE